MDEPQRAAGAHLGGTAAAVQLARAKLTLSLRVRGVRADGYHLLEAEMVTLDLADVLELSPGAGLEVRGLFSGEVPLGGANLALRAMAATGRSARIRLDKRIPVGAGLGGGSADAAAVLRWAGCSDLATAASIGSDVPFCLVGGRALVSGAGELLSPLDFSEVDGRSYTLLTPPVRVSTEEVYRAWDRLGGPSGGSGNDLEPAALEVEPALARYRDLLGDAAGTCPCLAGSGGTWFVPGEFPGEGRVVVRVSR